MALAAKTSIVAFIFATCYVRTYAKDLTCKDCIALNATLLIGCKNVTNSNITDLLCANSVSNNCTLKTNCSENINPTSSSAHATTPISSKIATSSSLASSSTASPSSTITPSPSPTPTTKPPHTKRPDPKPAKPGRRFDTASFIGGILLCGGLILLVYIAVRCYKSKPDYSRL